MTEFFVGLGIVLLVAWVITGFVSIYKHYDGEWKLEWRNEPWWNTFWLVMAIAGWAAIVAAAIFICILVGAVALHAGNRG